MRIVYDFTDADKIRRPISGRYITVKHVDHEIAITGLGNSVVNLGANETYDLGEIKNFSIQIENSVAGSNHVELEITDRPISRSAQNNISVSTTATIEVGDVVQDLPYVDIDPGETLAVCTSNGQRKYARLSLLSDATGFVLMGGATVDETGGGPIEPGQHAYEETTAAIWVHNPATNPDTIRVYIFCVNKAP